MPFFANRDQKVAKEPSGEWTMEFLSYMRVYGVDIWLARSHTTAFCKRDCEFSSDARWCAKRWARKFDARRVTSYVPRRENVEA